MYDELILFIINIIASGYFHFCPILLQLGLNKLYSMWYIFVNNV